MAEPILKEESLTDNPVEGYTSRVVSTHLSSELQAELLLVETHRHARFGIRLLQVSFLGDSCQAKESLFA